MAYSCKKVDRCGVCGGDGLSCAGCKTVDFTESQAAIDSASHTQKEALLRLASALERAARKAGRARAQKMLVERVRQQANQLQVSAWTVAWTELRASETTCDNEGIASVCATHSNVAPAAKLEELAGRFLALAREVERALRVVRAPTKSVARMTSDSEKLYAAVIEQIKGIPAELRDCQPAKQDSTSCP